MESPTHLIDELPTVIIGELLSYPHPSRNDSLVQKLNKVTSEFPKGPDGVEVDLAPFRLRARAFAEQLALMLEQRACTLDVPVAPSS